MRIIKSGYLFLVIFALVSAANAESKYYRYKDTDGNLIISSTLNPEKAKFGYEVIDATGRILKKVEPEITSEQQQAEIDKKNREAEQKEFDVSLMRKYSFVADIEAEKKRKLAEMQATISIVKGNLNVIRADLEEQYASAAVIERSGKPIPDELQKKIKEVEAVVITTEELYKLRQAEMKKASDDYDNAIKRFQEIQALRGKK